ncbi:MAG: hypothetical protein ACI35O_04335 [Bacillaceae bacterium]
MNLYVHIQKEIIEILEKCNVVMFISYWDNNKRAIDYYNKQDGFYTSYNDNRAIIAKATTVKVYSFIDKRGIANSNIMLYLLSKEIIVEL